MMKRESSKNESDVSRMTQLAIQGVRSFLTLYASEELGAFLDPRRRTRSTGRKGRTHRLRTPRPSNRTHPLGAVPFRSTRTLDEPRILGHP